MCGDSPLKARCLMTPPPSGGLAHRVLVVLLAVLLGLLAGFAAGVVAAVLHA